MSDPNENGWADVEHAAQEMFNVWVDGCELEWAKEAWGHLLIAGLTNGETTLAVTAANLRLVSLARIYQEFCGIAWDENPQTSVTDLAEDLEIDPVALGILAASEDSDKFDDAFDEYDLREAALIAVTDKQRAEIFQCLKIAYGGDVPLYARLSHTRSAAAEEDSGAEEFEPTGPNCAALDYVMNGFQS